MIAKNLRVSVICSKMLSKYKSFFHEVNFFSDREREDGSGASGLRSLEDREVSAMFHRDTLLARIVR